MIARLRGILIERQPDSVVVECGGVGYDVGVSLATLTALPEPGAEVTLRVFTHAQENRIALYGFATAQERELFDLLITVKNVGPATAISILSGIQSPEGLARTIAAGDVPGLVRIKGVGKKTAELLVVELREKCEHSLATWGAANRDYTPATDRVPARTRTPQRSPLLEDVASALINMGWRAPEVDKTLLHLDVPPAATVETLLVSALRAMPR